MDQEEIEAWAAKGLAIKADLWGVSVTEPKRREYQVPYRPRTGALTPPKINRQWISGAPRYVV